MDVGAIPIVLAIVVVLDLVFSLLEADWIGNLVKRALMLCGLIVLGWGSYWLGSRGLQAFHTEPLKAWGVLAFSILYCFYEIRFVTPRNPRYDDLREEERRGEIDM